MGGCCRAVIGGEARILKKPMIGDYSSFRTVDEKVMNILNEEVEF